MKFDIFDNVKSGGQICTNDLLMSKTFSQELTPLWNAIATCKDKNKQQQLKKRLPGVTWQAHFPQGRRVNSEAEPSGLYMVDIDHVDNPSRIYSEKIAGRLDELGILVAHITPSRKGLRLVAMCRPEFDTIEQNQAWMAAQIGEPIDEGCKDLARFSYLVPDSYFLHFDGSIWERAPHAYPVRESEEARVHVQKPSPSREALGEPSPQDAYRGIPLSAIAAKWLELNGGEPQPGERNTVLFELATRMRYICEFNPETIARAIPHCGLPDVEVQLLCKSACATQRSTKMPSDLKMVLNNLQKQMAAGGAGSMAKESDGLGSDEVDDEDFLLRMPRLPIGLKESLQGVPDKVKMPILCGVMPLAMAYATDVSVRYCDGNRQRLNLMSIIWGRQASGKSAVKDVIDLWKRPMKEADAKNRQAEDEFKKLRKNRKANEKLPEEPHNPILDVPITISCSTLLKRMKNAGGKHLFSFGEELDTLRKTNGAGSWSSKYDVYRLSFDNGEWGQDYNSDQSESGVVDVAYNWTVLGTQGAVEKCFKGDSVENGMSGRVLFAKMPSAKYEYMPKYNVGVGDSDSMGRRQRIEEAVHILANSSGFVDTPKLRRVIQKWCDQKADEARKAQDDVLDTFRKRAAVIGFRCGVVFQLLENASRNPGTESKSSMDFSILIADYALKYQTELFGQQLLEVSVAQCDVGRRSKNKTLFDDLPDEFTFDLLKERRPDAKYNALRFMVYNWRRNGLITVLAPNRWQKSLTPQPPLP